jgi:thymidylate synthase ThyX
LRVHGSEDELLAALLFEAASVGEDDALAAVAALAADERASLLRELVATRENRRHRPGRGFETLSYRFEIVSDYGAFRDLQRHRLLTCQWQRLSPDLGADLPDELVRAGLGGEYERALELSRNEYERLRSEGFVEEAPYALSLAYRIRYVLELDAREALHLIELRSGREGHPSYRAVAQQMLREIAEVHPHVAAAMTFVDDSTEERLERLLSEMRNEARSS